MPDGCETELLLVLKYKKYVGFDPLKVKDLHHKTCQITQEKFYLRCVDNREVSVIRRELI